MYRVTTDGQSQPQIDALPPEGLSAFAEVHAVLGAVGGDSINERNPDAGVRTFAFGPAGQGLVTYLILEDQRRVDVLDVLWLG